jgi:hypothetical protein
MAQLPLSPDEVVEQLQLRASHHRNVGTEYAEWDARLDETAAVVIERLLARLCSLARADLKD